MLNVLKNSILIVLFVLVSSSGILAKGQNLSFKETCLERKFCRNEICEVSTVPLLLFFHESCELTLGYSHVVPDSKSQLVPSFLQRNQEQHRGSTLQTQLVFPPLLDSREDQILRLCPARNHCLAGDQTSYRPGWWPSKLQLQVRNLSYLSPVTKLVP